METDMKLLVFALISPLFAHPSQEITARTPVPSTAPQQQTEPTSLVLYDVRDIAASLGGMNSEPESATDSARKKLEDRITHYLQEQRAVTARHSEPREDGSVITEQLDPGRDTQIARGTSLLADVVKQNIEPALDANLQSINIASPGSLAVVGTKAQHAWLARFFALAKRTDDLVQIETRWVSGPRGSFEKLGLKGSSTLPTPDELTALLKKLEDDKTGADEFNQLLAPQLVARNLQRATISTIAQIAYVKEWHVTFVQPGPQEIADPVIDTINAGEKLEVRTVRVDENLYRVALDVEHVAVAQPIATKKVRVSVAPGGEAEVGLPVVTRVNFSADVKLTGGNAVVLVTPLDDKKDLALIVKLTRYVDPTQTARVPERK
jgi:hypothetical protein